MIIAYLYFVGAVSQIVWAKTVARHAKIRADMPSVLFMSATWPVSLPVLMVGKWMVDGA